MTEPLTEDSPLTNEELAKHRAWIHQNDPRLLATIDADRAKIKALEWLVGEKDRALRLAQMDIPTESFSGSEIDAGLALTVADYPKEQE